MGNQFVDGWNWPFGAIVVAGMFLFGTGLTIELMTRKAGAGAWRAGVGMALATAFLHIWMNGAIEIAGEDMSANLMSFVVPIVGVIGAAGVRFRPCGMARALFATAPAQALVPVIALIRWNPRAVFWAPGVLWVVDLSGFFVILFIGSALLFRKAAGGETAPGAAQSL